MALLGYGAAGVGAVVLVLGAAMISGVVVVAIVIRGLARALVSGVERPVSAPARRAEGRPASAESLPPKPRPRVAG